MAHGFDPLFGRGGRFFAQGRKGRIRIEQMHAVDAEGIAAAQDGRHVVWVMDVIEDQGQIDLASGQHVPDASGPSFGDVSHGRGT